MLATMACVLGGFAFVVVRACRKGANGNYQPQGRRWTDEKLP